jgi:hypothetical protein
MGAALMAVLERQRHEDKTCNQCQGRAFMTDGARSVMGMDQPTPLAPVAAARHISTLVSCKRTRER